MLINERVRKLRILLTPHFSEVDYARYVQDNRFNGYPTPGGTKLLKQFGVNTALPRHLV
jgi:hypothetical protein